MCFEHQNTRRELSRGSKSRRPCLITFFSRICLRTSVLPWKLGYVDKFEMRFYMSQSNF